MLKQQPVSNILLRFFHGRIDQWIRGYMQLQVRVWMWSLLISVVLSVVLILLMCHWSYTWDFIGRGAKRSAPDERGVFTSQVRIGSP
jgi:hypothetical protein